MVDNDRINVKLACFDRDPHPKRALQIQSTNAYSLRSINIINSKKQKKFLQIAKKAKQTRGSKIQCKWGQSRALISDLEGGNYKQRREFAADLEKI